MTEYKVIKGCYFVGQCTFLKIESHVLSSYSKDPIYHIVTCVWVYHIRSREEKTEGQREVLALPPNVNWGSAEPPNFGTCS